MWMKLDLDGIIFHFRICGYRVSTPAWDVEWSRVDFTLKSGDWLNYQVHDTELLLMCEIEELQKKLQDLISDKLTDAERIEFLEPDLACVLYPKKNLRFDSNDLCIAQGYGTADISMELEVAFWYGGLTANRLNLFLDRQDIETMLCYLNVITGRLNISDKVVQEFIHRNVFYCD